MRTSDWDSELARLATAESAKFVGSLLGTYLPKRFVEGLVQAEYISAKIIDQK